MAALERAAGAFPVSAPVRRWLWLFVLPGGMRRSVLRTSWLLGERLGPTRNWFAVGLLLGVVPLGCDGLTGWYGSWLVTPLLILPFLLAAVVRDATGRGLTLLATTLAAHSALAMFLVAWWPESCGAVFPAGAAYWDKSRQWIVTGISEEYEVAYWLPAQLQLAAVVVVFAYLSLGLIPLWQGFHEVDLMNFYVGRLLAESNDFWVTLWVGWHPWSVCRGLGFLFLTFELASLGLEHLTATRLSTPRRRLQRWLAGLGFLALDMASKYVLLEPVRQTLAANLLPA